MYVRVVSTASAAAMAAAVCVSLLAGLAAGRSEQPAVNDGIVRVMSAYSLPETVGRVLPHAQGQACLAARPGDSILEPSRP